MTLCIGQFGVGVDPCGKTSQGAMVLDQAGANEGVNQLMASLFPGGSAVKNPPTMQETQV